MKQKINDWRPEVRALIIRLLEHGVEILRGDNGEDEFTFPNVSSVGPRERFVENLVACDEARLFVRVNNVHHWLYLVLGNSPGEIVSDYSVNPVLDLVTEAHYAEWELKGQPMCYQD